MYRRDGKTNQIIKKRRVNYTSLTDLEINKFDKYFESFNKYLIHDKLSTSMSSIPYFLYMYRKELQRRRLRIIRLSQAKINLTGGLVIENVNKINSCLENGINSSKNELKLLAREITYKNNLQNFINYIEADLKSKKKLKPAKEECDNRQEAVAVTNH